MLTKDKRGALLTDRKLHTESSIWLDIIYAQTRITDGRPAWEPPIMDYTAPVGDIFVKKREAVLKHTGENAARTTEIMDTITMYDLVNTH